MERYLIWSHEHNQWWAPNHEGYVASVEDAGEYSKNEAADIVLDHIPCGEEVAVNAVVARRHGTGPVWGCKESEGDS